MASAQCKIQLVTADGLALLLGVPDAAEWLLEEAFAGRIPSVMIGRRLWFNPGAVRYVLNAEAMAWWMEERG